MNIEVHQPRLEALIHERMASGLFQTIEDALLQALESAPLPVTKDQQFKRTGLDLLQAMQAMPYKDVDIEPARPHMPVRTVTL